MNAFRWFLTGLIVLLAGGYLAFFILASNFRRSFGASDNSALLIVVPLLIAGGLVWWIAPWSKGLPARLAPEALAYPVLLVDGDKIAEVCLSVDELTQRPENTDHVIEQRFTVVDAGGRRYRIENYRPAEPRPSTLSRVVGATFFNNRSFRVAFDLRPDAVLTRDQVLAQLRARDWQMPATNATTPTLGELFVAYRADRFREYGNRRDAMPEVPAPARATP